MYFDLNFDGSSGNVPPTLQFLYLSTFSHAKTRFVHFATSKTNGKYFFETSAIGLFMQTDIKMKERKQIGIFI